MKIRIVPGLSVAALKAKLSKELALWYCLRAINDWGSGRLDQTKAIYALTHNFNYSKSAAYRDENNGEVARKRQKKVCRPRLAARGRRVSK